MTWSQSPYEDLFAPRRTRTDGLPETLADETLDQSMRAANRPGGQQSEANRNAFYKKLRLRHPLRVRRMERDCCWLHKQASKQGVDLVEEARRLL